jgi:hypothetical protein
LATIRFNFTKIRAPIAGTFTRPLVAVGNVVKADETVLGEIVQAPTKVSADVRALQKERHDILMTVVQVATKHYQAGRADFHQLVVATREAMDAALELSETPARRLQLLREHKKLAEEAFKITKARFESGRATEQGVLLARAALLDVQIRILREEEKIGRQTGVPDAPPQPKNEPIPALKKKVK